MRTALEKVREAPRSTKARILATAERVFAAKGFAGASTREIASQAGVNISSLPYHWESKETLYRGVFASWIHARGGKAVADLDVPVFMLTMYIVVMKLVLDSRHAVSLLGGSLADSATRERVRRHVARLVPTLLGMRPRKARRAPDRSDPARPTRPTIHPAGRTEADR